MSLYSSSLIGFIDFSITDSLSLIFAKADTNIYFVGDTFPINNVIH
jgi:hypothetical protein